MKKEETIAKYYLESLGYTNIIFEPNGNRTPDFLINDNIAVEVRRLNQFINGTSLEKTFFNIVPKVIHQIECYNKYKFNKSAFVGIKFTRPLKINKTLKEKINSILENHSKLMERTIEYEINENLVLTIFPSEELFESQYVFGTSIDYNEGGFVLSNIYQSLKLINEEKFKKISPYKNQYKTWWLLLVDNIGHGIREHESDSFKKSIDFDLKFDKTIIISPFKNQFVCEL